MSVFYLGTHITSWLTSSAIPLFVSHRRLMRLRQLPRAACRWMLDSGGFTEISMFGEWRTEARPYVAAVQRYAAEIGQLEAAAIQDWMCEPFIVRKTGLSVAEHQRRTVASYLELMSLDSSLPWLPVLQGFTRDDYLRCFELYRAAGVDLTTLARVGLGSVCRRQATSEAAAIVTELSGLGVRLHGFGFKLGGLALVADQLASSDSLAWSYDARRSAPLAGCTHLNCANCRLFAEQWYQHKVLPVLSASRYRQMSMLMA